MYPIICLKISLSNNIKSNIQVEIQDARIDVIVFRRWTLEFRKVIEVTALELTLSATASDFEFDLFRAFNVTYWRRISQVVLSNAIYFLKLRTSNACLMLKFFFQIHDPGAICDVTTSQCRRTLYLRPAQRMRRLKLTSQSSASTCFKLVLWHSPIDGKCV